MLIYFNGQILERDRDDDIKTLLEIGGVEIKKGDEAKYQKMVEDSKINTLLRPAIEKFVFSHEHDFNLQDVKKATKAVIKDIREGKLSEDDLYSEVLKSLNKKNKK